jgi:hypothetical protein
VSGAKSRFRPHATIIAFSLSLLKCASRKSGGEARNVHAVS